MAISLDQAQNARKAEAGEEATISSTDVELAVRMAIQMLNQGNGIELIKQAIDQSNDPAQVIGQFLAQLMGQLAEQLGNQVNLDPRVFLAEGGFLELILDYIESKLGYPEEFSDQIYNQVLETIKAAAMGPEAPNDVMGGGQQQGPAPAGGGLGG